MTTTTARQVLRVLHVGVANRGKWPLEKCNADTGFEPAALCDVSPDALAGACKLTGLPESACYTDYDKALADADVDCVILCVPTLMHVPMTLKAIDAGLPVMVEKGMAPDWAGATQLVAAVQAKAARVCIAQNYRYKPVEATITRAVHDPSHPAHPGKVHTVIYQQNRVRPLPRTLTFPFSSIWDMTCHHFDNMMAWLGPITRITAFGWRADWSAYNHDNTNTAAHLLFDRGTHGHYLHTHDAARSDVNVQFHGERGALVYDGTNLTFSERPLEQFGKRPVQPVTLEPAQYEADMLRDFHRYVTEGVEPGISAANNLQTMAACEMMVRSISDNRPVSRSELDG